MNTAGMPRGRSWKQDLAAYLEVDRGRSLGQIASVVLPYLGMWVLASIIEPSAQLSIGLGLGATVFLVRMYSLFHDLSHNSMFDSSRHGLGPERGRQVAGEAAGPRPRLAGVGRLDAPKTSRTSASPRRSPSTSSAAPRRTG